MFNDVEFIVTNRLASTGRFGPWAPCPRSALWATRQLHSRRQVRRVCISRSGIEPALKCIGLVWQDDEEVVRAGGGGRRGHCAAEGGQSGGCGEEALGGETGGHGGMEFLRSTWMSVPDGWRLAGGIVSDCGGKWLTWQPTWGSTWARPLVHAFACCRIRTWLGWL